MTLVHEHIYHLLDQHMQHTGNAPALVLSRLQVYRQTVLELAVSSNSISVSAMAPKVAAAKAKAAGKMAQRTIMKAKTKATPQSSGSVPKAKAKSAAKGKANAKKGPAKGAQYQRLSAKMLKGNRGKSMSLSEKIETMVSKDMH